MLVFLKPPHSSNSWGSNILRGIDSSENLNKVLKLLPQKNHTQEILHKRSLLVPKVYPKI